MTVQGYITLGAVDGCECGGVCGCDSTLGALWGLAGLDAGAQTAIAASGQTGRVMKSAGVSAYVPGTSDCKASGISGGAQNLQLAGKAGGLALTAASVPWAGAGTALISAPLTFGISIAIAGIVGIFSTIFQHHAQAVAKEQSTLCTAVPAANNYFTVIDQAVASGQATAQQALQALASLSSDFRSAVSGIYKNCNAACVMQMCLDAAVATQKAKYTALAAQQAAAAAAAAQQAALPVQVKTATPSVAPGAAQSSGPAATQIVSSGSTLQIPAAQPAQPASTLPNWWPIAALAAVGFLIGEFA